MELRARLHDIKKNYIVMIGIISEASTGESRKLFAEFRGPFRVWKRGLEIEIVRSITRRMCMERCHRDDQVLGCDHQASRTRMDLVVRQSKE
ncbi:uncharacterized protein LOC113463968 isoform X2 [Ceratina calcarata]|uniref:Uncharacterized protein LOC113463968 isoform X2 n=1 Tax=Ceratina calcarata TaxID=156304 RepID=A0AAJ7W8P2_9HYME|nr:uncharacterized protein LOC113463968 isoform X2 [Ceratina calcarata]